MMSYSVNLRERAVGYVRGGGSLTQAALLFQISRVTLYRWLGATNLRPRPAKERRRKLDPDALLRERAIH